MGKYYKITLIGSGNLAWHLAQALENIGHSIVEVYSKELKNAEKLCSKLYDANPTDDLDFSQSEAELFIVAVSDSAIPEVLNELNLPEPSVIAHTSGTESIDVFKTLQNPCGVLYPIQTFTKSRKIEFKEIPISIEFSDRISQTTIQNIANSLSRKTFNHSTEQRRVIHLASVFAANFTNHILTISKGLLESNDLSFELVKPLISEAVGKALNIGPEHSQTGPAKRKDFNTIEKHLDYLSEEQGLTNIYQAITDDIIKTYGD